MGLAMGRRAMRGGGKFGGAGPVLREEGALAAPEELARPKAIAATARSAIVERC